MMEVFLEKRVVGDHTRYAPPAREPNTRVVGKEWRLNMHEIEALVGELPTDAR